MSSTIKLNFLHSSALTLLYCYLFVTLNGQLELAEADQPHQQQQQVRDEKSIDSGSPLNIKPSTSVVNKSYSQQQQLETAAANLELLVLGNDGHNPSHMFGQSQPLGMHLMPPGLRRFDHDDDHLRRAQPLATGQGQVAVGNHLVIPQATASELMSMEASRGRNYHQHHQHNNANLGRRQGHYNNNNGGMLAKIVDNGSGPGRFSALVNAGNDQVANMNQNYNRRALLQAQQQMQAASRRASGGHSPGPAASRQEESRKRTSRPYVVGRAAGRQAEPRQEQEEDGEKASDRRSDAFDRDDDNDVDVDDSRQGRGEGRSERRRDASGADEADDDNDDEDDVDESSTESPSTGANQNRLRQAASRQQHQRPLVRQKSGTVRDDESSVEADDPDEADEEAADSTSARQVTVGVAGGGSGQSLKGSTGTWTRKMVDEPMVVATSQLKEADPLQTAAGHNHGHHGGGHYYQYVEVPKKKAWKFGFKRGNHKHEIMRHEKGHKHKFHSSFKWHAKEKCKKKKKCKSVGKMTWEYKHHKKHHHHHP